MSPQSPSLKNVQLQVGSFHLGPISCEFPAEGFSLIRGVNGSGKTSLLRLLLGRLRLQSGRLENIPSLIAAVGVEGFLMQSWTVEENWHFFLKLAKKPDRALPESLKKFQNEKVQNLSAGQKRKTELLAAFALAFPLYLLDEPLSPLDQSERHFFLEEIRKLKSQKSTILMTSHDEDFLPQKPDFILELSKKDSS